MLNLVPVGVFFTKGVGFHKHQLQSFELALRDANIAPQNLVYVSSILPPGCKILGVTKGVSELKPGQITFCVLSRNQTDEPNRLLAASIGLAVPKNEDTYGYLSEHHAFGQSEQEAGDYAEDLAVSMLGSTLGIDLDPEMAWNERKQEYRANGKIIKTQNITQSTRSRRGGWTTVLAAAVFLF